jgi:hypothetical protein
MEGRSNDSLSVEAALGDQMGAIVASWIEENYDNYIDFFQFSYDQYRNNSLCFIFNEIPVAIALPDNFGDTKSFNL